MKSLVEFIAEGKKCKGCKIKNFDKDILKKKKFKHLKFGELKKVLNESWDDDDDDRDPEEYYENFEDDVATYLYNFAANGDEEETKEMLEYFVESDGEGELWDAICEDLSNDGWGAYNQEYDEYELQDDDMCRRIAVRIAQDVLDEEF